jgi:hypothetical protein
MKVRFLKTRRGKLIAILVAIAVVVGWYRYESRQSAVATAIVWARLAPFPTSATNRDVDIEGSMFTREFVISFTAPAADIDRWIAASAGPASATQTVSGSVTTYAITPGGGADFAEVKVDKSINRVIIHTYWS